MTPDALLTHLIRPTKAKKPAIAGRFFMTKNEINRLSVRGWRDDDRFPSGDVYEYG